MKLKITYSIFTPPQTKGGKTIMKSKDKKENQTKNDDIELEIRFRVGEQEFPVIYETVGKDHVYKSVGEVFSILAELW